MLCYSMPVECLYCVREINTNLLVDRNTVMFLFTVYMVYFLFLTHFCCVRIRKLFVLVTVLNTLTNKDAINKYFVILWVAFNQSITNVYSGFNTSDV